MRAVYTVGLRRHSSDATDSHGNAIDAWADPIGYPVYAIAPTTSNEPDPSRTAVVTGYTLLAPPDGEPVTPLDRFVLDGVEWEVVGEIADWTRGPFGFRPGVSINLTRAAG